MPDTVQEQFPPAKWEVAGAAPITFPVERIEEAHGMRLVAHERVYRPGARLDNMGARYTIWRLTVTFFNSPNHEDGVDGLTQYPDVVNALCAACKIEETGTLTIPSVGKRRCQAATYNRVDEIGKVDACGVVFEFWEDNEDDAAAQATQSPSALSVVKGLANDSLAAAEEFGATSFDLGELVEFAAELEALAMAPGDFVTDLESQANAVANRAERVHDAFTNAANEAATELRTLLTDPTASRAGRTLQRLADTSRRILGQKSGHVGRVISRRFEHDLSIFDIAVLVGQSATDLMAINIEIPDLLAIPARTPVKVFAEPGLPTAA